MAAHGLILRLAVGWLLATCLLACSPNEQAAEEPVTLDQLADWFEAPPMAYRPYVWWHWMGSNFSKEGITKDLEAMKEAGVPAVAKRSEKEDYIEYLVRIPTSAVEKKSPPSQND